METTRHCKHCSTDHPLTEEYWQRLEESPRCKAQVSAKGKKRRELKKDELLAYAKKWREENKEKHKEGNRKWREENAEKHKQNARDYYHANKELRAEQMKAYREQNRDVLNEKKRESHKKFPERRLAQNLRVRLVMAIKRGSKAGSAIRDLGCSIPELKLYLEAKFQSGMTWDNYGSKWHCDHIKPLSNYDLSDREVLLQLVHYTNLQPLWAEDNIRKSNKE
jgi:hypothetical protein